MPFLLLMNDIFASIGVGINQVAFGHPFDTCLTLIQNKRKWWNLPVRNYYKGCTYPLASSIIFNCTVFPIYNRTIEYTKSGFLSGLIGGVCVAPLVFVSDVGKIKRQTNQSLKFKDFYKSKGKFSILTRECIAMPVYIGTYDYLKNKNIHPLIAGGAAGLTNWSITYPIDVVKSRQICSNISIKEAIRMGNLWKGYSICATRAIIVNATNFYVYESLMRFFKNT